MRPSPNVPLLEVPRLPDPAELPNPASIRHRFASLQAKAAAAEDQLRRQEKQLDDARAYLELAPKVEAALQSLGRQMFLDLIETLEQQLTLALQEVLEQPLKLKALVEYKRGGVTVEFHIERDGHREDIMKGQGGSVVNVLSVGLRLFALSQLDPAEHRPFLLLDEPDGWLRPDLVPRLVKIIHEAGSALGFQIILISHHEVEAFIRYADKVYAFIPQPDGSVKVVWQQHQPAAEDMDL